MYGLDVQRVRWSKNWLKSQAQWVGSVAQSLTGEQPEAYTGVHSCSKSSFIICMMGQSVSLANCHPCGYWQDEETGTQELHEVQQGEATSPTPGEGTNSRPSIFCGPIGSKAALQRRTGGSWWTPAWTRANNVPLWKRGLMISWVAFRESLPTGQGMQTKKKSK